VKKFCLVYGLLLLSSFSGFSQNQIRLNYGSQSRTVIPAYTGGLDFIAVRDLVALIEIKTFDNPAKKKIILFLPSHQIKITGNNAFIMADEKTSLQMPVETTYIDGILFVPVKFFIPILNSFLASPVLINDQQAMADIQIAENSNKAADKSSKKIKANITSVEFEKKSNGLLLRVKTDKVFQKSDLEIWKNKNWLYATFSGGVISDDASEQIKSAEQYKIIRSALTFQHKNSAQVSFQLEQEIAGHEIYLDEKTGSIMISLRVNDPVYLEKDVAKIKKNAILTKQQAQWKIDKIVLDAGHGGKDHGATGKNGTAEKDITLAVILKLGKLITDRLNIAVDYTRRKDEFPTLKGRTQYANAHNAKLFVSVHCNSSTNRKGNGFEVFFLSPSRTSEALAVARKENEVIQLEEEKHDYGDFTNEKFILANIMQSVFVKESEELAEKVLKGIAKNVNLADRGVTQAPFYVLMGASMPSILVETAFISNPAEEKYLKSEEGQNKLAEGIFEGIKQFIESAEKSAK
jgi:N-acetylmuramoyl-L-alanine amidase